MILMETYLLYCSVRLGVMVISVLSFISIFVPSIILFVMGLTVLNPILKLFNGDENFRKHTVVNMLTDKVENDSTDLKVVMQLYFFAHMTACILAFYGSLKLKKYFLLPLIFFDFWRVIYNLTFHIILMTVSKSCINLGILIISTLAGGFLILLLVYNWATCVALYQIINLINSERYKSLYGEDPFNPLIPKTINSSITENFRVLITPTSHYVDEQKKRNTILKALHRDNILAPQPIISVLPFKNLESNINSYRNTTTPSTPRAVQGYFPTSGFSTLKYFSQNDK